MEQRKKKLSVIVSVYNEEAALEAYYEAFEKNKGQLSWDYEILFVNDGSSDSSLALLKGMAQKDAKIKVISFSRNFGHEAAMIAGIDHASGDALVCMDADLQHPVECLPQIIDAFEEGYEVINMIRLSNKSAGIIKNITSKLFYKVVNLLSDKVSFEENASDFFAISKRVAEVLKNSYREKNRFLRGYVQSVGFKKTTIRYEAAKRVAGKSHYSLKKLLQFSVSTIILYSDLPLKLGVYAGGISALLGTIVLVYTLFTYKDAPSGYATIVILITFLFAVLFIVVGVIGEYIAVLFSEIKDRPIYIVEQKMNMLTDEDKES